MKLGRSRRQAIYVVLAGCLVAGAVRRAYGAQDGPPPAPGSAPGPVERVIQLRDGTLYSGVILEWVPGSRVTLQLPTGELRRFRWVDLAPETLPAPPPLPAVSAPVQDPEEGPVEKTRVTIRTKNRYVTLRKNAGPRYVGGYGPYVGLVDDWRIICLPPCNLDLPRAGLFRVGTNNDVIIPSRPFELPPGSATIDVKAGTWSGLVGGVLLTTFGSMTSILGAGLFGGAATGVGNLTDSQRASVGIGGIVALGVGVGLLTGGIVMLVQNNGTKVRILDAQGNRVALPLPPRRTLALSAAGLHF